MSLDVMVDIQLSNVSLKRLPEIKQDIELLSGQPHVEVYPSSKNKKLDYGRGYRLIRLTLEDREKSAEVLEYTIIDHAYVEGAVNPCSIVGSKSYTQEEVEELRRSS